MMSDTEILKIVSELELQGCKIDIILPSGRHMYFSTHCRHDLHGNCSATVLVGGNPHGDGDSAVARRPAQCKTCAAPCVCGHHA